MIWRFHRVVAVLAFSIGGVACGSEPAPSNTGTLAMRLRTELNGTTFQLRGARFDVTGPEDTTLEADQDPSASSLQATLNAGSYSILLRDGWRLERQSAAGMAFETVPAELDSPNPSVFAILDQTTTDVAYQFEVESSVVNFGEGNLNLSIQVRAKDTPVCSGATPNPCGTACVNLQTDRANCGACGVSCGALGCNAGACTCPAGQQLVNGRCLGNDGQVCTQATDCANGCTLWFADNDGDGFGTGSAQGRCGANSPPPGGRFATRSGDCCDSEANAFPGQTTRFGAALPAACVGSAAADHDWNCNGRNEGALTVNCAARSQANCAAGSGVSGQLVGDIVPVPQVDVPDPTSGVLLCGRSVGPGTCQFFTAANPASAQGLGQGQCDVGCCPARIGFTQLPCN